MTAPCKASGISFCRIRIDILCFVMVLLGLGVLVSDDYAHHDQYRYFGPSLVDVLPEKACQYEPQFNRLAVLGRWINAHVECLVYKSVFERADLTVFRAVILAFVGLFAIFLRRLLIHNGAPAAPAAALAIGIALLPGAQNAVLMANFANILSPLLALWAGHIIATSFVQPMKDRLAACFLAATMLMVAMMLYQALSFMIFVPLLARLLWIEENFKARIKAIATPFVVFGATSGIYLIIYKIYATIVQNEMPDLDDYTVAISIAAIPERLWGFFTGYLVELTGFWLVPAPPWALAVILALISLAILTVIKQAKGHIDWWCLAMVVAVTLTGLAIYGVSNAPFLFRTLWPFSASLLTIVIWAVWVLWNRLNQHPFIKPLPWAALVIIAVMASHYTTKGLVQTAVTEFNFLTERLQNDLKSYHKYVYLLPADEEGRGYGINGRRTITDEFNRSSTAYRWNVDDIVRIAVIEAGIDRRVLPWGLEKDIDANELKVLWTAPGEPESLPLGINPARVLTINFGLIEPRAF